MRKPLASGRKSERARGAASRAKPTVKKKLAGRLVERRAERVVQRGRLDPAAATGRGALFVIAQLFDSLTAIDPSSGGVLPAAASMPSSP